MCATIYILFCLRMTIDHMIPLQYVLLFAHDHMTMWYLQRAHLCPSKSLGIQSVSVWRSSSLATATGTAAVLVGEHSVAAPPADGWRCCTWSCVTSLWMQMLQTCPCRDPYRTGALLDQLLQVFTTLLPWNGNKMLDGLGMHQWFWWLPPLLPWVLLSFGKKVVKRPEAMTTQFLGFIIIIVHLKQVDHHSNHLMLNDKRAALSYIMFNYPSSFETAIMQLNRFWHWSFFTSCTTSVCQDTGKPK